MGASKFSLEIDESQYPEPVRDVVKNLLQLRKSCKDGDDISWINDHLTALANIDRAPGLAGIIPNIRKKLLAMSTGVTDNPRGRLEFVAA